ncbi:hypothetical protein KAJ89_01505 [Candidatus Parcubacteria bacterium]|nr:hypothetical protein [Candidatus Parcubacteria bacterium]
MIDKIPKIDYPDKISSLPKKRKKYKKKTEKKETPATVLTKQVKNPLWISISMAAQLGGVNSKTIRRAIQAKKIRYKITGNRYFVDFISIFRYLHKSKKLSNKLREYGVGQYIIKWRE